jgi:predicted HTH domain antitoxin
MVACFIKRLNREIIKKYEQKIKIKINYYLNGIVIVNEI